MTPPSRDIQYHRAWRAANADRILATRIAWQQSANGRAHNWVRRHTRDRGPHQHTVESVVPWMDIQPACCPYTGQDAVALHMNKHTFEIEGWCGQTLNHKILPLPLFGDSLAAYCDFNSITHLMETPS